jgi:hypothetical protein
MLGGVLVPAGALEIHAAEDRFELVQLEEKRDLTLQARLASPEERGRG